MLFNYIKLLLAVWVFYSASLLAEEATEFKINNTHTLQLKSEASGLEYELYIRLPRDYSKNNKQYPVAVINDTSYSFAVASGVVHLMVGSDIEDLIIVGISYSKGENPVIRRTRDYTPHI